MIQSQENFKNLPNNNNESREYCKILEEIKSGSNTAVKLEGLLGFFLPRLKKSNDSLSTPLHFGTAVTMVKMNFNCNRINVSIKKCIG
jgi:hypothetical protein